MMWIIVIIITITIVVVIINIILVSIMMVIMSEKRAFMRSSNIKDRTLQAGWLS